MDSPGIDTYWAVAVAYNCGYARFMSKEGPPPGSLDYGAKVMERWYILTGAKYICPIIR
jgi:hypothetical protein